MAVATVTITGNVYDPEGVGVTKGTISCKLSQPGSALDGAASVRVAGEGQGNITAGGLTGLTLVPNDAITPSGTYYIAVFEVTLATGRRVRWAEKWQLASTPATIDIGAVSRLDVVPGVALGLVNAPLGGDVSAGVVTPTGATTARSLRDRASDVINVRDFGAKGDGIADDRSAIQAAVDAASAGSTIYLPRGTYKIDNYIAWKSRLSMRGDGPGASILKMSGVLFSAIYNISGSTSSTLDDCTFKDFEIDGSGLTYPTPHVDGKGIFILYMKRARFENLYIHDCIGTGLGVDFLQDSVIHNVVANHNGRNWDGVNFPIGQSGIGIGTGAWAIENVTISDCHASNNGNFGIFVEDQALGVLSPPGSRGARILNSYTSGNRIGFANLGSGGALFLGCESRGNAEDGFYTIRTSGDRFVSCLSVANQFNGYSAQAGTSDLAFVNSTASENARSGIRVDAASAVTASDRVQVSGGQYVRNGQFGIILHGSTQGIRGYQISSVTVRDNGTTLTAGSRAGVAVAGVVTDGQIFGNWIGNSSGGTDQSEAVLSVAGATVTTLSVTGNTIARANATPAISVAGTGVSVVGNHGFDSYSGPYTPLTYSASIAAAVDASDRTFKIVVNNGTAFSITNPTGGVAGQRISFHFKNTSGGAMGTLTWGTNFRSATGGTWAAAHDAIAYTARPATGYGRIITFRYDGGSWYEESRSVGDVAN